MSYPLSRQLDMKLKSGDGWFGWKTQGKQGSFAASNDSKTHSLAPIKLPN